MFGTGGQDKSGGDAPGDDPGGGSSSGGGSDSGGGGSGGGVSGGGCFIATAAYGTPMAEEVKVLSKFRDEHLLNNRVGKELVKFYYNHGRVAAEYIRKRPVLKRTVGVILKPAVWLIEQMTDRNCKKM